MLYIVLKQKKRKVKRVLLVIMNKTLLELT